MWLIPPAPFPPCELREILFLSVVRVYCVVVVQRVRGVWTYTFALRTTKQSDSLVLQHSRIHVQKYLLKLTLGKVVKLGKMLPGFLRFPTYETLSPRSDFSKIGLQKKESNTSPRSKNPFPMSNFPKNSFYCRCSKVSHHRPWVNY